VWAAEVTGVIPDGKASLGVGLVNPGKGAEGPAGVQVRRRNPVEPGERATVEVRLDGAERETFKAVRTKWVPLKNVPWPEGEFRLRIEVIPEYGVPATQRRSQGRFRLLLNGQEVFAQEFGDGVEGERSAVFTRGRASQPVHLYVWADGTDGDNIQEIQVTGVTLTTESNR
jgi:hypothetical protein